MNKVKLAIARKQYLKFKIKRKSIEKLLAIKKIEGASDLELEAYAKDLKRFKAKEVIAFQKIREKELLAKEIYRDADETEKEKIKKTSIKVKKEIDKMKNDIDKVDAEIKKIKKK